MGHTGESAVTYFKDAYYSGYEGSHAKDMFKAITDDLKSITSDDGTVKPGQFKRKAVDSCFTNYAPEFTKKYNGVLDNRENIHQANYFLFLGIVVALLSTAYVTDERGKVTYVNDLTSDQTLNDQSDYKGLQRAALIAELALSGVLIGFILVNVWNGDYWNNDTNGYIKTGDDQYKFNFRDGTFQNDFPKDLSYCLVVTMTVSVLVVAVLLLIRVANVGLSTLSNVADFSGGLTRDQNTKYKGFAMSGVAENKVMRRVAVDVPFILGYALLGVSLQAESGVRDSTSLMLVFWMLFCAGLLQHISNVGKIIYDTLCRSTDSKLLDKLFHGNADTDAAKHLKRTLQFFGYTRLFVFFTVFFTSIAYLTMTRESGDAVLTQSFLNGQLFYFTFAFFWSNVGYDILRELIPFTFEKVHIDTGKLVITSIYLIFYNSNVNWLYKFTIKHAQFSHTHEHLHPF